MSATTGGRVVANARGDGCRKKGENKDITIVEKASSNGNAIYACLINLSAISKWIKDKNNFTISRGQFCM